MSTDVDHVVTADTTPSQKGSRPWAGVRIAVDVVALTIFDEAIHVLLAHRNADPDFMGLALPGALVRPREGLVTAAQRGLRRKAGVEAAEEDLHPLSTFADPDRDPRGRVVTITFLLVVASLPVADGHSGGSVATWVKAGDVPAKIAFDHSDIIADAVHRLKELVETTTIATSFFADNFTLAELKRVYEIVWGTPLDPGNFQRVATAREGLVRATDLREQRSEYGRPARLFAPGDAVELPRPLRGNWRDN